MENIDQQTVLDKSVCFQKKKKMFVTSVEDLNGQGLTNLSGPWRLEL